jgi:hypothetical protein
MKKRCTIFHRATSAFVLNLLSFTSIAYAQNQALPQTAVWVDADGVVNPKLLPLEIFEIGPDGRIVKDADGAPKKATTYIDSDDSDAPSAECPSPPPQ